VVDRFARGNVEVMAAEFFFGTSYLTRNFVHRQRPHRCIRIVVEKPRCARVRDVRATAARIRGNDSETRTDRKPERSNFS
jgi:hypothetical protein